MSSNHFQFKQFKVFHDRSSMKVGTDGVLIGCWAGSSKAVPPLRSMLDVGTGCGVIALMLAQKFPDAKIMGVDIDDASVKQAKENVLKSPFNGRIEIEKIDFSDTKHEFFCQFALAFQLIVANPPFYEEDTPNKRARENRAKHTETLDFEQMAASVSRLLAADGEFDVILPYNAAERFIGIAACHHLYLTRRCDIRGSMNKVFKRSMLGFRRETGETQTSTLSVRDERNQLTEEYQELTGEFYL